MTEDEENQLIAEKLLGWRRLHNVLPVSFVRPENEGQCSVSESAPWFKDWESSGLIIDALHRVGQNPDLGHWHGKWHCLIDFNCRPQDEETLMEYDTPHEALRQTALHYLKVVQEAAN